MHHDWPMGPMGTHVIPELLQALVPEQAPLWISGLRIWNPWVVLGEQPTITVAPQLTRNPLITLTTVALAL